MNAKNPSMSNLSRRLSHIQMTLLVLLRVAVGWHFLYEGIAKLLTPDWTSEGFLMVSKWVFAPIFKWIAATPSVLAVVDFMNIWGLILIGLGLMLGGLTRAAGIAGIVLLLLYYVSNPPFIGMDFDVGHERAGIAHCGHRIANDDAPLRRTFRGSHPRIPVWRRRLGRSSGIEGSRTGRCSCVRRD